MPELNLTLKEQGRRLARGRNVAYNRISKTRSNIFIAERPSPDGTNYSRIEARTPEELAENLVKSDKKTGIKRHKFNFDVWTDPYSASPRYPVDKQEGKRFLAAVSKAKNE